MAIEKVFKFINSALDFVNELNDQFIEERIESAKETLTEAAELLTMIGANGKFDKSFGSIGDIWHFTLLVATMLNGQDLDDFRIEGFDSNFKRFEDFSDRWGETKILIDCLKDNDSDLKCFSADLDLSEECNIFYLNIFPLQKYIGGIFTKRKFKKKLKRYSKRLYSVCISFIMSLEIQSELQQLEDLDD